MIKLILIHCLGYAVAACFVDENYWIVAILLIVTIFIMRSFAKQATDFFEDLTINILSNNSFGKKKSK